jgi:hypothetical protein
MKQFQVIERNLRPSAKPGNETAGASSSEEENASTVPFHSNERVLFTDRGARKNEDRPGFRWMKIVSRAVDIRVDVSFDYFSSWPTNPLKITS